MTQEFADFLKAIDPKANACHTIIFFFGANGRATT
jgi:hypothetical protein